MSIKIKTRKILWARSGNKCAICKKDLVSKTGGNNTTIVGQECHIVARKKKWARGNIKLEVDIDDYDNLILLCPEHHIVIDSHPEEYTLERLIKIKNTHELWVRNTLGLGKENPMKNKITLLPRISSGKELIDIIFSSSIFQFDYNDPKNEDEVKLIGNFFSELKDWGDLYKSGVIEEDEKLRLVFCYSKEIQTLDEYGFMLFGESKKARLRNSYHKDLGVYNKATLNLVRKTSSTIIDVNKWNKRFHEIKRQVDEMNIESLKDMTIK